MLNRVFLQQFTHSNRNWGVLRYNLLESHRAALRLDTQDRSAVGFRTPLGVPRKLGILASNMWETGDG